MNFECSQSNQALRPWPAVGKLLAGQIPARMALLRRGKGVGEQKGFVGYLGVVVWRLGVVGGGLFTAASAHRRRVAVGFWWGEKGMAWSGASVEGEEA